MTNQTPLGIKQPRRSRGRADIVFVLDASGSMMNVIEDLKSRLADFVEGVQANDQIEVDWRVATLGQDCSTFYLNEFTTKSNEFAAGLERISTGSDEYTLPAIDWAADMPWRENAHRFIVVLSDEPVEGGHRVSWQKSKLRELMEKLDALHIKAYIFAPESPAYNEMAQYPGINYFAIQSDRELLSAELSKILKFIGESVSVTAGQLGKQEIASKSVSRDLYGLKGNIREA